MPDSKHQWNRIHLNNIKEEDRTRFDTFDDEVDCLVDFCPWTPNNLDQVLEHKIDLSINFQKGFMEKEMCKPEREKDKTCQVSLNDILQRYDEMDPNQAFLNAFEFEVMQKLSVVERVSVIFYLRELTINEVVNATYVEVGMYDGRKPRDLSRVERSVDEQHRRQRRQSDDDLELGGNSSPASQGDLEFGVSIKDQLAGNPAPNILADGTLRHPFADRAEAQSQKTIFQEGKWIKDKWGFDPKTVFTPADKRTKLDQEPALVIHTKQSEKQMLINHHSGHDKATGTSAFATFTQGEVS